MSSPADPPAVGGTGPRHESPALDRSGRIPSLDALRGVAILLVMLYHVNLPPNEASATSLFFYRLLELGNAGVTLFFVLSGFLITRILLETKEQPHSIRNFYVRRLLRTWPLYYATLAVTFLVLPLFHVSVESLSSGHAAWLWFQGTNLLQAWKESMLFGRFSHFWSLAIEEQFYLFWPLVIGLCSRRAAIRVCAALMLSALVGRSLLAAGAHRYVAAYVLTPCRMDSIALGGLIALINPKLARGSRVSALLAAVVGLSAGLLLALFCWRIGSFTDDTRYVSRYVLEGTLFGSLLLLAVAPAGGFWSGRFLPFFGKYSYALYVFHPLVNGFVHRILFAGRWAASGMSLPMRLAHCAAVFGISLAAAILSWHVLERPALRWKDALAPRRSSPSV